VDVCTEGYTDRWVDVWTDIETGFIRWTQRSQSLNQSENSLSFTQATRFTCDCTT